MVKSTNGIRFLIDVRLPFLNTKRQVLKGNFFLIFKNVNLKL